MKKNHKQTFINQHGQEKWNLVNAYYTKKDRSPEATEAVRLYQQISQGLTQTTYTVYSISENGRIVYIGKTGSYLNKRWNHHKSRARTLDGASALHMAMNTISTNHDLFPEFLIQTITTTQDENAADVIEKALIQAYQTNITGYNKYIGGGYKSKKYSTRPSQPSNVITRNQSI
ncbi:MAG: GIY-YIG nuclease family protein [Pseudanabaena sp. M007S1SP1A06QC]|nr:GIY-YIG nuclease family protein [Pseudanabaena sp. M007S1SP1A06QC]